MSGHGLRRAQTLEAAAYLEPDSESMQKTVEGVYP
jgi:hypothetical protein